MSRVKKMTIKSLSEEMEIIKKDQAKEINDLKSRVIELEKTVEHLKSNKNRNSESQTTQHNMKDLEKCKQCDQSFTSTRNLKKHLIEIHPRKIKCDTCDKAFDQNYQLEDHIKAQHGQKSQYECSHCDKKFVLEWRLKKHQQPHSNQETRKCYFFNNEECCPYDDNGCMFSHELSEICKFDKSCKKKLCSYQHSNSSKKSNVKTKKYDCQTCTQGFSSHDTLMSHVEEIHVQNEKQNIDYLYPHKCENCSE